MDGTRETIDVSGKVTSPFLPGPTFPESKGTPMARSLSLVIPSSSSWQGGQVNIDDIPADVKADIEEAYKMSHINPASRIHAEFDDEAEMVTFQKQAVSYCAQRTVDGVAAPIRFRKTPTKGLPKNQMDFKVTDLKTDNETATDEIRQTTADTTAEVPAPRKGRRVAA